MSPELYAISRKAQAFLGKHHPVIVISCLSLLLAFAIYQLYDVLSLTNTTPTATSSVNGFDKKTIKRIQSLHDSKITTTDLTLPSPRPNPFVE